ncbi:MAG: hypothetical protein K5885_02335 [Bacteroidales bacterium]|nr:hypothetical protein [Bacteroidales bacterium]
MNKEDLIYAIAEMGADAYLVETDEQAEELLESIKRATYYGVIEPDDEEFATAKAKLDLESNTVRRIHWAVDGSRFSYCLNEDWDM